MPWDDRRSRDSDELTPQCRDFLRKLLRDSKQADLPGGEHMIALIEETLAKDSVAADESRRSVRSPPVSAARSSAGAQLPNGSPKRAAEKRQGNAGA